MPQVDIKEIWRWDGVSESERRLDSLATEEPLEIRVNGRPVSITMRTPGHDSELALGFLLSEGMIASAADVVQVMHVPQSPNGLVQIRGQGESGESNVLNVELAPHVPLDLERLTRHVFASSSCGICGKATIDSVHQHFAPIESAAKVRAATVAALPGILRGSQSVFDRTGGLHAAMIFSLEGEPILSREDVGRHNAVDKVLGAACQAGLLPLARHILLLSGRASFEVLQKALSGRIPIVAAVSAPSSLAVDFARRSNMTLAGFVRDGRMNIYAGIERVILK